LCGVTVVCHHPYLHRIRTGDELVELWRSSVISSTDFLLGLNGLHHRSFIDLSRYPIFPEVRASEWKSARFPLESEVIALLSPIAPFDAFDLSVNGSLEVHKFSRE
jgi:hypothetical protein